MHSMRTALVALALVGLAGCGSEEARPIPANLYLNVSPSRAWYHTGQSIELVATVTDTTAESIADAPIEFVVEPLGGATEMVQHERSATYRLDTDGSVTFTACTVSLAPSEVCDSLTLRVDDGAPMLEVESPTPGSQLSEAEGVEVRGSVADASNANVYVNGVPAQVDDMGRFTASVSAEFGVNHLRVTASDGVTDVSEVEMDILWAPAFSPALSESGQPEFILPEGIALWLGQDFFDDGVALDRTADPIVTQDLADILELVVASFDVSTVIPDPVVDDPPTLVLRLSDAEIGLVQAELDLTDDGVDLFIRLGQVRVTSAGQFTLEGSASPLDGEVQASVVAFAHLTVQKEDEDAELVVELGDLSVGLETIDGEFEDEEVAAVFRLAAGFLRTSLEDALLGAIRGVLEDTVPAVLRDALNAVDTALADRELEIEQAPFPPVALAVDGRIRAVTSSFRSALQAGLQIRAGVGVDAAPPEAPGVPRLDAGAMPEFFSDGTMKLGVRLALLNGILQTLWNSGLLQVDVTSLLPDSVAGLVSDAHLNGRMPPVFRPARRGEEHDLVLSLGQLELDLTFGGEATRFAVNLEAGVDIDLADSRLSVDVAEEPTIHVWTLVAPTDSLLLNADTVHALLADLWPSLREGVAGSLAFDLPIPALGDFGGIAPDLGSLAVNLGLRERMRRRGGALILNASFTGTLAPED